MKKKQYNVTLDPDEVKKSEDKIKPFGGKLATLLNNLLIKFNLE
jgi:hypothetical protein